MSALTGLTDYKNRLQAPREILASAKIASTTIIGRSYDYFTIAALAGAAPTTAVVPDRTTTGALGQQDAATEELYALGGPFSATQSGLYVLCDRLSHQGGLNATTTGAVTTNLPTAALTRYTSGEGVMLGISIYTLIGATSTTISCSYTNEAGTNGRTSPSIPFGNTGFRELNRMLLVPLVTGDTGVRSVENSTIQATTGTAGAFGYTLFKPLVGFNVDKPGGQVDMSLFDGGMTGGMPPILDNACLFWMIIPGGTSTGVYANTILSAV